MECPQGRSCVFGISSFICSGAAEEVEYLCLFTDRVRLRFYASDDDDFYGDGMQRQRGLSCRCGWRWRWTTSAELQFLHACPGALANRRSLNRQLDERDDSFVAEQRHANQLHICRHGQRKTVAHSEFPASTVSGKLMYRIGEIDEKGVQNMHYMRASWGRQRGLRRERKVRWWRVTVAEGVLWRAVKVWGAVVRYCPLLV